MAAPDPNTDLPDESDPPAIPRFSHEEEAVSKKSLMTHDPSCGFISLTPDIILAWLLALSFLSPAPS